MQWASDVIVPRTAAANALTAAHHIFKCSGEEIQTNGEAGAIVIDCGRLQSRTGSNEMRIKAMKFLGRPFMSLESW